VGCAEKEQQSEGRAEVDDLCGKHVKGPLWGCWCLNATEQSSTKQDGGALLFVPRSQECSTFMANSEGSIWGLVIIRFGYRARYDTQCRIPPRMGIAFPGPEPHQEPYSVASHSLGILQLLGASGTPRESRYSRL
jgi:hypothetical protein